MEIVIILGNIEKRETDAIVNASNKYLFWEDVTVNGVIHVGAGMEFTNYCAEWIKGNIALETSKAMITPGFNLKSKYIINTVGPVFPCHENEAPEQLWETIYNCMKLADDYNCKSISFPLISTGVFMFPKEPAIDIILNSVVEFGNTINKNIEMVEIVAYTKSDFELIKKIIVKVDDINFN